MHQEDSTAPSRDISGLIHDLDAIVWEMDARTRRFTFVSRRAEDLVGYPLERWLSEPDFWARRLVHPDDREWASEFCRKAEEEGRDHGFEYRVVAADGRVLWLRDVVRVSEDAEGRKRLRGVMFEITEQKRAEEALHQSEARFRSLIENVSDIIAVVGTDRTFRYISPSVERVLGYPASEVLGRSIAEYVPPKDAELLARRTASRLQGEADPERVTEVRARHADGSWRILQVRGRRYEYGEDEPAVVLSARDVTEERTTRAERDQLLAREEEVEAALERREQELRILVERSPDVITRYDVNLRHTYVSPAIRRAGLPPEAFLGKTHVEVAAEYGIQEPFASRWSEALTYVRETGTEEIIHFDFPHPDGAQHWECRIAPVLGSGGIEGLISVGRDVTAQKRAELALEKSEAHLRGLLEGVRAIVWECDAATWAFTYISHGVEEILGYPVEQWYADADLWANTIHPEDRAWVVDACLAGMRERRDSTIEYRSIARDGRVIWLRDIIRIVLDSDGSPSRLRGVMIDITDAKGLEEQLRQAQRMEAVGRLAGGIAHDFNNLLTAIRGHTEFLLEELGDSDPRREDAQEIRRASERAAGLTRQLLAFSRKQILKPEPVDLNAIVSNLEKMLRRLIGEEILLETALSPGLGRVLVDPGQIEQVLMNLVVNARDAMPKGGRLVVVTQNTELAEEYTSRFAYPVRPGRYVLLAVQDSGTGMPPEVRERIFEPFFTTKEHGKGTGLGLSTVYGIVNQSGGHIWVYTEEGEGTTFKIFLPRVDTPDLASKSDEGLPERTSGVETETVLVVEDEEAVRSLIGRQLRKQGYRVLEAVNGMAAVRLIQTYRDPIHLVITDVVMPEMGGRELAEELWRTHPELPVLFMSGYTEDELVRRGVTDGRTLLLEKPFSPGVLVQKVREALAREGS